MKHALVTVQSATRTETFCVSATNAGEWKTLRNGNLQPLRSWQEEERGSEAANMVDFSALPVNKLSDTLPHLTFNR